MTDQPGTRTSDTPAFGRHAESHRSGRSGWLRAAVLGANDGLREYVQERLSGQVRRPDGTPVRGPATALWNGRNKPHRQDRKWVTA